MKKLISIIPILAVLLMLNGCTKEVTIDIPGYQEQLVIDGQIETDSPPFVLISKSKEVYAPTDLASFLNGFVSGAIVTVSDGTTTVQLDELCSDNLPPGSEEIAAAMFGISVEDLANYTICAYTSFNTAIWGQVGKTYTLTVTYEGKTYTAETSIVQPTNFADLYWKAEPDTPNHGYSWVTLSDPPNQYDAYKWEMKRINTNPDGSTVDSDFTPTFNPVFDDEFFDGLTFDFFYENPKATGPNYPDEFRWLYPIGDTVVIKLSKMDRNVYEFFEKKYTQLATAGNPFATPTNIPNNITGGALGVWAGYSPSFDTLACYP
jgi:hypothetical protein